MGPGTTPFYAHAPPRLIKWLAAGMLVFCAALSVAAAREIVFIVEPPYLDPQEPPTDNQRQRIAGVEEALTGRVLQLQIDGHFPVDGADVARRGDVQHFQNADLIVQVLLKVGRRGTVLEARMYHKTKGVWSWSHFADRLFGPVGAATLERGIANEVLPKMLVRIFELAQPESPPLLFADCLFAPKDNEKLQEAALTLSFDYAGRLSSELRRRFRLIRLVPTPQPQFYAWWCVQLANPRIGLLRDDTTTVYGYVNQTSSAEKPKLRLAVSRRQRIVQASEPIEIDDRNMTRSIKRIADVVETLTNGF